MYVIFDRAKIAKVCLTPFIFQVIRVSSFGFVQAFLIVGINPKASAVTNNVAANAGWSAKSQRHNVNNDIANIIVSLLVT